MLTTYITLFIEFFKAGLFAVGGGLATLPFLYAMADKYPWFDRAMLADMVAISESTPGPIGVNMATYAGFNASHAYGILPAILGAVIATIGLVAPSIIVIILVAKALTRFSNSPYVKAAFYGLRPAVTAMIAAAGYGMIQVALFFPDAVGSGNWLDMLNIPGIILFAILLFLTNKYKKHPAFYIAGAALVGIVLGM